MKIMLILVFIMACSCGPRKQCGLINECSADQESTFMRECLSNVRYYHNCDTRLREYCKEFGHEKGGEVKNVYKREKMYGDEK